MYGRAPAWKDKIDDKNSSLIGHSERRIEIASGGGERRSIATRDVRVSRHRQDDCPPPTGSSPAILTKIKKEKKASRYRWDAGFSDVLPSDYKYQLANDTVGVRHKDTYLAPVQSKGQRWPRRQQRRGQSSWHWHKLGIHRRRSP
ncbi:hypothetical protein PISMIDRAFT_630378 [Pisolithus microcarpus 441]|uniref:Uncharacterized protein n=1 Tax=Pisolithus microcarpus 441 TaxID=765257 RepID=A0A0C9Z920_9AGAM|nr:hypothetical protein PISMIDRAFT_630378 [Pisolithus microcarpus 441]